MILNVLMSHLLLALLETSFPLVHLFLLNNICADLKPVAV